MTDCRRHGEHAWSHVVTCSVFLHLTSDVSRVSLLQLDSAACKEMSVSDTEVSDVTWTDNGTFNLSEGHTPQTENSEGTFCRVNCVTH